MCKFFSLVSDGNGKPYYFDWELRKKVLSGELKDYEPDSHTSIADYFGFKKEKEDKLNKYEYSPFLEKFEVDQINTKDDSAKIEKFCKRLDFKKIIEPMTIKKIIHPFRDIEAVEVTDEDLIRLKEASSVRDSVRDSIWDSVGDSVRASVRDGVGDSVWASVRDSVWASVWDSIWDSIWDSVGDSIWAQIGSMFDLPKWKYCEKVTMKGYPFQSYVDLWNKGLVPSFDGKVWRLHGGKYVKVLWEGELK